MDGILELLPDPWLIRLIIIDYSSGKITYYSLHPGHSLLHDY